MLKQLEKYVKDMAKKYPNLRDEIMDLYDLCVSEIEEGGSEAGEIYSCREDIIELIKH